MGCDYYDITWTESVDEIDHVSVRVIVRGISMAGDELNGTGSPDQSRRPEQRLQRGVQGLADVLPGPARRRPWRQWRMTPKLPL